MKRKHLFTLLALLMVATSVFAQERKTRPVYKNGDDNSTSSQPKRTRPVYREGDNSGSSGRSTSGSSEASLTEAQKNELKTLEEYVMIATTVPLNYDRYSIAQMEAEFAKGKPEDCKKLKELYDKYIAEGIPENQLSNAEFRVKSYDDFLNRQAPESFKATLQDIKTNTQYANTSNASEADKERALAIWEPFSHAVAFVHKLDPSNSEITKIHNEAQAEVDRYNKYFEGRYAQYVKTSLHKKYREQVVLSYSPLKYGSEREGQFLDEVVIDGNHGGLYFMYYGNVPNRDMLTQQFGGKKEHVYAQLQLNDDVGDKIFTGCMVFHERAYDLSDQEETQAYLALPIFPSPEDYKRDEFLDPTYYRFMQCMTSLPPDVTHKARIVFGFPGSTKEFSKTFTLRITNDGMKEINKTMNKIEAAQLSEVRMRAPGNLNSNSQYISMVNAAAKKKGWSPTRTIIISDRWETFKEDYYPYEPKFKAIQAQIAYEEDGGCTYRTCWIMQKWTGNGFGSTFVDFDNVFGGSGRILCENVNK